MAFKGGVVLGPVSLNATLAANTNINGTTNTGTVIIGNSLSGTVSISSAGTINIGNDAVINTINIGSAAANKTINIGFGLANMAIRIGVANGTSSVAIESGSGGVSVNSVGGSASLTGSTGSSIDAAGGSIGVGAGNSDVAINIGILATAGRTITIGNTTGTTGVVLNSGSAGVKATGVAGVVVANKNYVTINTVTGALGSDNAPLTSISITGDTGGALTGSSFTFAGGTTGLSFGGSGSTETLTFAGITANGGTVSLATDATTSTINVGTGAGAKTSTFGSASSTSATTVQSGSGVLNVTSTGGALTINSGTGALGISTDASATTISIGTGGAVKGITLGSTNTTSSTAIKSGSGNVAINSGLTIDSTGRNYNTVQPCFQVKANGQTNVTGDATVYTVLWANETFDQGNNFASPTFTAPIAGRYLFTYQLYVTGLAVAHTSMQSRLTTTGVTFQGSFINPGVVKDGSNGVSASFSVIANMAASDTANVQIIVSGGTKVAGVDAASWFSGVLLC